MSIVAPIFRLDARPAPRMPNLRVGAKVKLAEERQRWTVRGVTRAGRFVILTKPFNIQHTVLYAVVDFDRGVRGKDNYYGLGYESTAQVADALHAFQHEEDGEYGPCDRAELCVGSAEVSSRAGNHVRLDFESIDGQPCKWNGEPA